MKRFWMIFAAFFVVSNLPAASGSVFHDEERAACIVRNCPMGGGGDGFPWPFDFNQRVELADGEVYLLKGKVVFRSDPRDSGKFGVYIEVDFKEHPWLASQRRRVSPFYPLMGPPRRWKPFQNKRVKVTAMAHAVIDFDRNGEVIYTLSLDQLPDVPIEAISESMR